MTRSKKPPCSKLRYYREDESDGIELIQSFDFYERTEKQQKKAENIEGEHDNENTDSTPQVIAKLKQKYR